MKASRIGLLGFSFGSLEGSLVVRSRVDVVSVLVDNSMRQGRPLIHDKLRRDKHVPFVVTQDEYEQIKRAADAAGETVSTWVRDLALKAAKRPTKEQGGSR